MATFFEKWLPGMPRERILGGSLIFVVALAILAMSIRLVPELQLRAVESDTRLFTDAMAILHERDGLKAQHARLVDRLAVQQTMAAVIRDIAILKAPGPAGPSTGTVGQDGKVQEAALDPETVAQQLTSGNHVTLELAALDQQMAAVEQAIAKVDERYLNFAAQSSDRQQLLARLEAREPALREPVRFMGLSLSYHGLVLLVAMLMGALGGIIGVGKTFLTVGEADPPPSDYFIRPVFGAVLGFVAFLMFKSGQSLLSMASTDDQLNPFPIALLGVVSGLMAKDVIASIENWGERVFGQKDAEQNRRNGDGREGEPNGPGTNGQAPPSTPAWPDVDALALRVATAAAALKELKPEIAADKMDAYTALSASMARIEADTDTQLKAFGAHRDEATAAEAKAGDAGTPEDQKVAAQETAREARVKADEAAKALERLATEAEKLESDARNL